jgi:DNA-binding NtrC family response regulator
MARILIIDDDKSFREALAESVRDFGHDVIEAGDPKEAFKLIEKADVAFLDLKMPGMSGIDFLREPKPGIRVIVLTAFADSSNTIEAIRLGAFNHLTKPIGRTVLETALAAALKAPQPATRALFWIGIPEGLPHESRQSLGAMTRLSLMMD